MRAHSEMDISGFTRFGRTRHPLYLGIALLVVIEATVSASLIVSYFYLRAKAATWPPPEVVLPELFWPTVNMLLLLASAGTMWWAGRGINRGSQTVLSLGVGASTVLATVVLGLRILQFVELGFRWDAHAYGSIVWTITGFHFVHVTSAVLGTAAITVLACRGYFTKERQLGVVVDTLYWYFVAWVWVPFYAVLYLVPRLS